MQIGIDTFVPTYQEGAGGSAHPEAQRVRDLLDEIELADTLGIDAYGIGEHHREEFVASSPATLLAAAASRTRRIRLGSSVTVLSSDDPVRVFQQFATIDLISGGRAEITVGRGSFIESYPLFGFDLKDYDALFAEKLDLLLKLRDDVHVHWSGKHRAPLSGQGVYPRPLQERLPIRLGVGGTPNSFVRAGTLGLPLVVAIIGGEPHRFRPLIEMYREAGRLAGHPAEQLTVGVHTIGFIGDTTEEAVADYYPSHSRMMNRIGRERGWPPFTPAQFDAARSPRGALMLGAPDEIVRKVRSIDESLGGIDRLSILLDGNLLPHDRVMHAIHLLGTEVAPAVRQRTPAMAP